MFNEIQGELRKTDRHSVTLWKKEAAFHNS